MTKQQIFRSGFVSIIGRPNVGKSTLINRLLGQKLVIISDKPQTTRNKIHCVLTREDGQIIFIDTPGIHKPKHKLGSYMVNVAVQTLTEVDLILFVCDGENPPGGGDQFVVEKIKQAKTPTILVVNKIDQISKNDLVVRLDEYNQLHDWNEVIPLSALTGDNVNRLVDTIINYLPEGPQYYPEDMVIDQPERFIVAELVREKVLKLTREEIPHSVAIEVIEMQKRGKSDTIYVRVHIYVERDSQKGIIIGKGGEMLKGIGAEARGDIERLLGSKIYLDLLVKVKKDWRNSSSLLKDLGYE
jgi:GTP-binding protein Era